MTTEGGRIDFMFLGLAPPQPDRWIRYCDIILKVSVKADFLYQLALILPSTLVFIAKV